MMSEFKYPGLDCSALEGTDLDCSLGPALPSSETSAMCTPQFLLRNTENVAVHPQDWCEMQGHVDE